MGDDRDRRTLPPSAQRLRQARRDGQAPRSRDLLACVGLAGPLLLIGMVGEPAVQFVRRVLSRLLMLSVNTEADLALLELAAHAWMVCLALAAAAALPVLLVGALYNGWLFAPRTVVPSFARLGLAAYIERMFSARTAVELGKSVLKLTALIIGLAALVTALLPVLVQVPHASPSATWRVLERLFVFFFGWTLLAFAALAGFDAWFQRRSFRRELFMTPQEWRREQRDDQGDPHLRARRRLNQMESLGETALERCAQASHIICDSSTPRAVAVHWDQNGVAPARLLHKGEGVVALTIMNVGRAARRPLIEDPALCGRLFHISRIDAELDTAQKRDLARSVRPAS